MEKEKLHDLVLLGASLSDDINHYSCAEILRKCYIIHLVLSGKGTFECRKRKYQVSAGQFFFIFPGTLVKYYPSEDDGWKYCWIDFRGSEPAELFSRMRFDMDNPVTEIMSDDICDSFKKLCKEIRKPSYFSEIAAKGMFYSLMSYFCEMFPRDRSDSKARALPFVAAEYIKNNYYKKELSVENVAQTLNVNRVSLYRAFKSKFGVSPIEFIKRVRLDCACEILADTLLPIKTVSYSVGFDDPLYFSKAFRSYTGMPPSKYRKYIKTENRNTLLTKTKQ